MPDFPYSTYDPSADAFYFYLVDEAVEETVEVVPGLMMFDLNRFGIVIGVEVLSPGLPFFYDGDWTWLDQLSATDLLFVYNVVRQIVHDQGTEDSLGNLAIRLKSVIDQ